MKDTYSPEYQEKRLLSALDAIDPSGLAQDEWFKVGAALKRGGYDYGVFDGWSRRDTSRNEHGESRYNPDGNKKRWDSIDTNSTGVTIKTIFYMARERGWQWNYKTNSGEIGNVPMKKPSKPQLPKVQPLKATPAPLTAARGKVVLLNEARAAMECTFDKIKANENNMRRRDMMTAYLRAAFCENDTVEVVANMYGDGNPRRTQNYMKVGDLLARIEKCDGDESQIFGAYNPAAGVWVVANSFDPEKLKAENREDGKDHKAPTNDSITAFRNVLVESDNMDLREQERLLRATGLPIVTLTYSGGKSIHALVKVDAKDLAEYKQRVKFLFAYLKEAGFEIDEQNKNPARLTRFAGAKRGGEDQLLLDTNIGAKSWDEWMAAYNAALSDEEAQEKAEEAKARIEESFVENHIDGFFGKIAESFNTPHISTGFRNLDIKLGGGLYEGLYVIGAIPSLGKTTFVMQMADSIATQGKRVLIFSLEMARYELMAKSISRLTYIDTLNQGRGKPKTVRDITDGARWRFYDQEDHDIIDRAVNCYKSIISEKRLAIEEGMGDIGAYTVRDEVAAYTSLCGIPPVVVVDYLQILAPMNERGTDKQNNDKAIMELKRISRDFKIPVIVISSFNRDNYKNDVTMESFKETGGIEYSSDVLLGLQFRREYDESGKPKPIDLNKEKCKEVRRVELDVLKNRNGVPYSRVFFDYTAKYNYFQEV